MRDSLLETLRHPVAKKAYTFAAVVFAVAALAYHSQPEIGYHDKLARWGLPAGAVAYMSLRAWAAGAHRRVRRDTPRLVRGLLSGGRDVTSRLPKPDLSSARASFLVGVLVLTSISGAVAFGSLPAVETTLAGDSGTWSHESTYSAPSNPKGVDKADNGWIWVVDASDTAHAYSGGGLSTKETSFSTAGAEGLAVGHNDNIYIAKTNANAVVEYKQDGTKVATHGFSTAEAYIDDVAYDPYSDSYWMVTGGNLVETDTNFNTIREKDLDADGVTTYEAYTVAASGDRVFVHDDGNVRVLYKSNLTLHNTVNPSSTSSASGMSKINDGDYLVADNADNHINRYSGTPVGYEVSGTVSNADGNGIDGATVEIRQSGSVVKTATANATGVYSVSAVQDGTYTVRASASGYQNGSKEITVAGSPKTVDLSLPKEGTYVRTFRLDDETGAFGADETVLELYEYQPERALNGADPWTKMDTKPLNSQRKASFRLTEGETYRVTARVTAGDRAAEQTWSGLTGLSTYDDPYVLETELVLGGDWYGTPTATPTSTPLTPTATPAPDATATPTLTDSTGGSGGADADNPNDDTDDDGIPDWFDRDDDADGEPDETPSYDAYGPTYLSSCTLSSGEDGARIQYYDPGYNTTQLDYNLTGPDGAVYNGSESFDTPIGLWSECVAGRLTDNVTDTGNASVVGNATFENGSTVPLDTNFSASGPSFTSFAPMGDPADTPAEQGTAFGLTALGVGASYLASRRTNVLQGLSARSPVDPVFAGGSALSVLMGLEFASGGAVSAATANGVQTVAPLAGLGAVGYGGYWVYSRFIQGQNVTIRGGS